MYAIFLDRQKQHFVKIGSTLKVDFLKMNIGEIITFDKLLYIFEFDRIFFGTPYLKNKCIKLEVLAQLKGKKNFILKFKRRKNYIRRYGFRQKYTLLKALSINEQ